MKAISFIMLLLAYMPMFFLKAYRYHFNVKLSELGDLFNNIKDYTINDLFNDMYGILTALGIAFYLWEKYIREKKHVLVPLASLFSVIGVIFILNSFLDNFYKTYYPGLIIILSILLCYIIMAFFWLKYKRQT
jgi:hypothetical protein